MNAAVAEIGPEPATMPPDMLPLPAEHGDAPPRPETTPVEPITPAEQDSGIEHNALTTQYPLMEEIRVGFDELRQMNHNEMRAVIKRRVEMLETELREREQRRAAIETARLASRMLDLRRQRAQRIQRRVNFGSALAAVASTMLIFVVMT